MSKIITLDDHLNGSEPRSHHKGNDFCTKNQVMNVVLYNLGPIAKLLDEVVQRQKALEDHVGYVHPEPPPEAPPIPEIQQAEQVGGDTE